MSELVNFYPGSVPVAVASRVLNKDACWVRAGIINGWLPIGVATRNGQIVKTVDEINGREGRINYYISPKQFYELTGFVWKGERV